MSGVKSTMPLWKWILLIVLGSALFLFLSQTVPVVGSEDNRTPQWMSEKIYNAMPAGINKKLSVYEGAGHGGTEFPFFVDWGRWAEETVGFML